MKKTLYTIALLTIGLGAAAQNLNPTVEVTNAYKREASGIEKPGQILPLPDSVMRFACSTTASGRVSSVVDVRTTVG